MPNLAILLATHVPVPRQLPAEPPRRTPWDQAVLDHEAAPGQPFPSEADHPDPLAQQPPRDASLASLFGYRGIAFQPVARPRGLAFLASLPKPDAFNLGASRRDELGRLHDVLHAYGGDGVALWTWGQSVQLWAARSASPGARPCVLQLAIRAAAGPAGRPAATADGVVRWLEGSALAPDAQALRSALAAPTLSVPALFAAFGVPGAGELQAPDAAPAWNAFVRAADALLRGAAPDADARKTVNALIASPGHQLPSRAAARRGATAARVAAAHAALRDALGEPAQPRLAACAAAAGLHDAITSGPAAAGLLQATSKRAAVELALGRLLSHHPLAVRRDPLFLALAAQEAETWNGHFFAGGLAELAERAATSGFTVALYPAAREQEFRAAHGLRADAAAAREGWAGEAAIGPAEGAREAMARWFARAEADGAVLHCEPDGTCNVQRFAAGRPTEPAPLHGADLVQAARALDPRGAVLAAGFPDVLAPGPVAAQQRDGTPGGAPVVPRAELARLLDVDAAAAVASPLDFAWPREDARMALLVRLPAADEPGLAAIAQDLRTAWMPGFAPRLEEGRVLWLHTGAHRGDAAQLARLLGDLPVDTRIAIAHGDSVSLLRIAERPPVQRPRGAAGDFLWVPPRVLLHAQNVYATADASRLSWYRAQGLEVARELAALYPGCLDAATPATPQQALDVLEMSLRDLGFVSLGDLLASQFHGCALRACVHRDAEATATLFLLPARAMLGCELRTRLGDGTDVVTSSLAIPWPRRAGTSLRAGPAALPQLWEAHVQHVAEARGERQPQAAPRTLAEFAATLEP